MRIISGQYKSRLIKSPASCHPMGDKIRMALFNMLGDLTNLTVLDAYGGSGALAIESFSRGAKSVVCLEIKPKNYKIITDNIAKLDIDDSHLMAKRINAATWVKNQPQTYDLVILDPPYDDIRPNQLTLLASQVVIGGRLALSYPNHYRPQFAPPGWQVINQGNYGFANLAVYEQKPRVRFATIVG